MSKLKIYGISGSRAIRSLWMAEELGLDYEHVKVNFAEESKTPEYLAVNPNGRIPSLDDDGLILWESLAINLYLAKKEGGDLSPRGLTEDALATQWSIWALTECEKPLLAILLRHPNVAMMEPDEAVTSAAREELDRPFKVLDAFLEKRDYLMGRFTVADLNVASVLMWINMIELDISGYPNIKRWLDTCLSRPAFAAARDK